MCTFRRKGQALFFGAVVLLMAPVQPLLAGQIGCFPHEVLALQQVLPGVAVVHGRWPTVDHTGIEPMRAEPVATTVVLGRGPERTVVDPGPSQKVGLALRDTLMCQQGARVTALVNTHAHAEQVLANSAWTAPVMALAGTAKAMHERCPQCLASLTHELGETGMQGTRIVLPQMVLRDGQWLQAGGRGWWVQEMRRAHTEHDLVLWSPSSAAHAKKHAKGGVVLVGGLVDGRWPVLAQGSVLGWLAALERLKTMQPDWLIGQHLVAGPSQVRSVLERQHGYLCGILGHAWRKLEQGQSEAEGMQGLVPPLHWPAPEQGQAKAWQQQHVFNQRRAWREAEQLWLERQAWPKPCGSAPDVGR